MLSFQEAQRDSVRLNDWVFRLDVLTNMTWAECLGENVSIVRPRNETVVGVARCFLTSAKPYSILGRVQKRISGDLEMSVRIVALLVAASFTLAPSSASAFGHLFGHRAAGCDACGCEMAAPSCGCEIAMPSCGCEIAAPVCDPCASPRVGLFARLKAACAARKSSCCDVAPSCGCEMAAPTCGCEIAAPSCGCAAPAPTCGCEMAAPSCGCEIADPCGCSAPRVGLLARLKAKCAARKSSCCDVAPSCGCEMAAPSCGCEMAAPSCGCGY